MSTPESRKQIPEYRRVTLDGSGGVLTASYSWAVYRFLFSDGQFLDVKAIRDDSDLRAAVLEQHYGKTVKSPEQGQIVGVAILPDNPRPGAKVPAKRQVRRGSA
jgi:hypothetical protein